MYLMPVAWLIKKFRWKVCRSKRSRFNLCRLNCVSVFRSTCVDDSCTHQCGLCHVLSTKYFQLNLETREGDDGNEGFFNFCCEKKKIL